jgi:hypothetical protein
VRVERVQADPATSRQGGAANLTTTYAVLTAKADDIGLLSPWPSFAGVPGG